MEKIIIRDVPENEGLLASTSGDILSTVNGCVEVLNKCVDSNGYYVVCALGKQFRVARLVAQTFPEICGQWFEGCEVDHISTVRTDDRAENLRVCTHISNMNNPITIENFRKAKNGRQVAMYDGSRNLIGRFPSSREAERQTGICNSAISKCCNGTRKKAGKRGGKKFYFKWIEK